MQIFIQKLTCTARIYSVQIQRLEVYALMYSKSIGFELNSDKNIRLKELIYFLAKMIRSFSVFSMAFRSEQKIFSALQVKYRVIS